MRRMCAPTGQRGRRVHGVVERVGRRADAARPRCSPTIGVPSTWRPKSSAPAWSAWSGSSHSAFADALRVLAWTRRGPGAACGRRGAAEAVALRLPDEHAGEARERVPGPVGARRRDCRSRRRRTRGPLMPSANPKCSTGSLSGRGSGVLPRSCAIIVVQSLSSRSPVGQPCGGTSAARPGAGSRRQRFGRRSSASSSGSPSSVAPRAHAVARRRDRGGVRRASRSRC